MARRRQCSNPFDVLWFSRESENRNAPHSGKGDGADQSLRRFEMAIRTYYTSGLEKYGVSCADTIGGKIEIKSKDGVGQNLVNAVRVKIIDSINRIGVYCVWGILTMLGLWPCK